MNKLDRIAAYVTVLAVLFGGITWLTNIDYTTKANAKGISHIKYEQDYLRKKIFELLTSINTRLSRIEGELTKK